MFSGHFVGDEIGFTPVRRREDIRAFHRNFPRLRAPRDTERRGIVEDAFSGRQRLRASGGPSSAEKRQGLFSFYAFFYRDIKGFIRVGKIAHQIVMLTPFMVQAENILYYKIREYDYIQVTKCSRPLSKGCMLQALRL